MKPLAVWTAAAALLAAGCASPPEVAHPELDFAVPAAWTAADGASAGEDAESAGEDAVLEDGWWMAFGDPMLNEVVLLALEHNHDLDAAAARVERAAAQAGIVGAEQYPTLGLGLNGTRRRQNFVGFPIPGGEEEVLSTTYNSFGVSLDTFWELDLWGRVRSETSAALADLQAQQADLYAARLSIAGQTIKAWLAVAEAQQQVLLAERTVESFQKSTDQVMSRYRMGIRSPLDVRLSLSNLEDARALLQESSRRLDAAVRQLEILAGRYPGRRIAQPSDLPHMPGPVPAGLPAELIARRPDLAAVERRLSASHQRFEAARAALYPRLSLTASGGTATGEFSDLLDKDFRVWSLIGNLTQPIFEGGRLRAGVDLAAANEREALAFYAGAVLNAYVEVETALAAEQYLAEGAARLASAAEQAEAAQALAEDRYRSGLESYITVLESQRRALTNLSALIVARRERLDNRVNLYLALGGGFQLPYDAAGRPLTADEASADEASVDEASANDSDADVSSASESSASSTSGGTPTQ